MAAILSRSRCIKMFVNTAIRVIWIIIEIRTNQHNFSNVCEGESTTYPIKNMQCGPDDMCIT